MERLPSPSPFGRAPAGSSSLLTYEPYYGLREKPFSLSTDPRFLYRSPEHTKTFEDLLLAIRRREGLVVLTGDIGTGKTTLCKAVIEKLDRKTFTAFVPDPFISRGELIKRMLLDFGVMSVDELKTGQMANSSHSELSYPLYEFLKSLVPLQAFAVLIIDETQNLSLPLLEEIRILSDLEAPEKLLQVVLVGQLELRLKLKLPEMRQLDQRVSARCALHALTREAVGGYIAHRLEVAGGSPDRVQFSPEAVDTVFRASGGVPRLINLLCDRALHLCHLQRQNVIDASAVLQSVDELGVGNLTAAPIFERAAPVIEQAAPAVEQGTPAPAPPPAAVAVADAAPPGTTAAAKKGRTDLSGLDVDDIADDLYSPVAVTVVQEAGTPFTPIQTLRTTSNRSLLDESPSVRRWRNRARSVALAVVLLIVLASAVVMGEVVMSYDATPQMLPLPERPRPPQIAPPSVPIPPPPDALFWEPPVDVVRTRRTPPPTVE